MSPPPPPPEDASQYFLTLKTDSFAKTLEGGDGSMATFFLQKYSLKIDQ